MLRERFDAVVADPASPVRPLLDGPAAAALRDERRPIAVDGWGERRNVEMVLQLDSWLRHYRVRLDV